MGRPRRSWWRHWSLLFPLCILCGAAALQGLSLFREVPQPKAPHLDRMVPASVPGWRVRNVPLGPNESVQSAVRRTLNYDDVVYRDYSRRGVNVGVYVAYWGAGKMPTRLVASHTPDRCWTENGWLCEAMRFREVLTVEGRRWLPAEWRLFAPPGGGPATYVYYWHLVDGRVSEASGRFNSIPSPVAWWRDTVRQATRGSSEQYFIRITANTSFDHFWSDPGFQEILRGVAGLGLELDPANGPESGD